MVPAPVLPPKEKRRASVTTSFRLPSDLLRQLEEVAKERGYSRNEVAVHFLRWAMRAFEQENGPSGGRNPGESKPVRRI